MSDPVDILAPTTPVIVAVDPATPGNAGEVTAESVQTLVTGAVSGDQLDALRAHIGASVVADPAALLQVHTELTSALVASGNLTPAAAVPAAPIAPGVAAEIQLHLTDMEQAIADYGSAGGGVLAGMIDLIRSKL